MRTQNVSKYTLVLALFLVAFRVLTLLVGRLRQQQLGTERVLTDISRCYHSHATRAPIADPSISAQLGGTLYDSPKLHPGPCSSVGMWPQTDRHMFVITIHFALSAIHGKCNRHFMTVIHVSLTVCQPAPPVNSWADFLGAEFSAHMPLMVATSGLD